MTEFNNMAQKVALLAWLYEAREKKIGVHYSMLAQNFKGASIAVFWPISDF